MHYSHKRMLLAMVCLPMFYVCYLPTEAFAQYTLINLGNTNIQEPPAQQEQPDLLAPIVISSYETYPSMIRRFFVDAEWYFSWGYSREWWGRNNIHISQPSQGNNFTIYDVQARDDPSWGSPFSAQYNIRLGRFVDEARTLAVELNFDHTKYTSVIGQTARVNGSVAGKPTNANYVLDDAFFSYNLHNGANHVMVNLVKRVPLFGETNENWSIAGIGKVGIGPMLPHAENEIMGNFNNVGPKTLNNAIGINRGWWQMNGWTTGVELGFRVTLIAPIYIEITDKLAYAQLTNVPVFQGTARHNLWMNEVVLSVGITYGGGR